MVESNFGARSDAKRAMKLHHRDGISLKRAWKEIKSKKRKSPKRKTKRCPASCRCPSCRKMKGSPKQRRAQNKSKKAMNLYWKSKRSPGRSMSLKSAWNKVNNSRFGGPISRSASSVDFRDAMVREFLDADPDMDPAELSRLVSESAADPEMRNEFRADRVPVSKRSSNSSLIEGGMPPPGFSHPSSVTSSQLKAALSRPSSEVLRRSVEMSRDFPPPNTETWRRGPIEGGWWGPETLIEKYTLPANRDSAFKPCNKQNKAGKELYGNPYFDPEISPTQALGRNCIPACGKGKFLAADTANCRDLSAEERRFMAATNRAKKGLGGGGMEPVIAAIEARALQKARSDIAEEEKLSRRASFNPVAARSSLARSSGSGGPVARGGLEERGLFGPFSGPKGPIYRTQDGKNVSLSQAQKVIYEDYDINPHTGRAVKSCVLPQVRKWDGQKARCAQPVKQRLTRRDSLPGMQATPVEKIASMTPKERNLLTTESYISFQQELARQHGLKTRASTVGGLRGVLTKAGVEQYGSFCVWLANQGLTTSEIRSMVERGVVSRRSSLGGPDSDFLRKYSDSSRVPSRLPSQSSAFGRFPTPITVHPTRTLPCKNFNSQYNAAKTLSWPNRRMSFGICNKCKLK